jgi:hypothetical protein
MYGFDTVLIPGILLLLSIPIFCLIIFNSKRWKKNYLFVVFYFCSLPVAFVNLSSHLLNYLENGSSFCVNNSVAYSAGEPMLIMCFLQSVVLCYFQWATNITILSIVSDLAYLMVRGKTLSDHWKVLMGLIFGLPLISVTVMLVQGKQGYDSPLDSCTNLDTTINYFPMAIVAAFSVGCMVTSYVTIGLMLWRSDTRTKRIHILVSKVICSAPLIFTTFSMAFYVAIAVFRGKMLKRMSIIRSSSVLQAHVDCVFHHYDGVNDQSWISVCGEGIEMLESVVRIRKYLLYLFNSQHFFVILSLLPLVWRSSFLSSVFLLPPYPDQLSVHGAMDRSVDNNDEDELEANFGGFDLSQKPAVISSKMLNLVRMVQRDKIYPEADSEDRLPSSSQFNVYETHLSGSTLS